MARLRLLTDDELGPDPEIHVWGRPFRNAYGHTPELLKALGPFYRPLVTGGGRLEPELRELVRLKVASHSECVG